jgi:RNA polymerase sigma-70 factor (ECF subfamily)
MAMTGINNLTDDAELLVLLRQGNEAAFTQIYERYHKMLYVLACRYLKGRELAEDAVQHVFIKLWEHRADIAIALSLRNYLFTMTKNYILNRIRSDNTAVEHHYRIAQRSDDYEDNLLETIEQNELMDIFHKAVALLPAQKREVCLLKMEEKLSNQDIADTMQISVNTVKTHYAQAVKMLRAYMEKMLMVLIILLQS